MAEGLRLILEVTVGVCQEHITRYTINSNLVNILVMQLLIQAKYTVELTIINIQTTIIEV